jgi:3-deoxy-7-phosphoheptulonate synthase
MGSAIVIVISLHETSTPEQHREVADRLRSAGLPLRVHTPQLISLSADRAAVAEVLRGLSYVTSVERIPAAYPRAARLSHHGGTVPVAIGDTVVGGPGFTVIAGPCSVESRDQLLRAAKAVRDAGGHALRGGAFKPRTSPYSFQGLGAAGLELLAEARELTGLPVVSEIVDVRHVELMASHVDVLQVGARNMQNYALLRELGRLDRPVLLKRGLAATVDETLLAAEYLLDGGNARVVLCERGIRTFEGSYRFTLDLAAVAVLKERTHLPVIVDPSHAAGATGRVVPLALAAAAVGADGVIVESHPDPATALCDGEQALPTSELTDLIDRLELAAAAAGRSLHRPSGLLVTAGEPAS